MHPFIIRTCILISLSTLWLGCSSDGSPKPAPIRSAASTPSQRAAATAPTPNSTAAASTSAGASGASFAAMMMTPLSDGFVLYDDGIKRHGTFPIQALLVPADKASAFHWEKPQTGFFTPTAKDVARFDKVRRDVQALDARLAKHNHRYQLVGLAGQPRTIAVNAFCGEFPKWKKHPVAVDDGGACFFQFRYDPATGAISKLMINGQG